MSLPALFHDSQEAHPSAQAPATLNLAEMHSNQNRFYPLRLKACVNFVFFNRKSVENHPPRNKYFLSDRQNRPAFVPEHPIKYRHPCSLGPTCPDETPEKSMDCPAFSRHGLLAAWGTGQQQAGQVRGGNGCPPNNAEHFEGIIDVRPLIA